MAEIPKFMYDTEHSGRFIMLPPDLYECEQFQELSFAAQSLYLCIAAHTSTLQERQCCRSVVDEYISLGILDEMDEGNKTMKIGGKFGKKTYYPEWFVIPETHLKNYGFKKSYVVRLKKELVERGFITVVVEGKGRYTGNKSMNASIYSFSNKWKSK